MTASFRRAAGEAADRAGREVADELTLIRLSGVKSRWANTSPAEVGRRKFEAWIHAPIEGPLPELGPDNGLNCWEMIFYAAVRRGRMTHAALHEMYKPLRFGGTPREHNLLYWREDELLPALLPQGGQIYTPGGGVDARVPRGRLVVWGWDKHVVMTTGKVGADGSPEVLSFWPHPKDNFMVSHTNVWDSWKGNESFESWGTVTDAVQLSTVDELTASPIISKGGPIPTIRIGLGPFQ